MKSEPTEVEGAELKVEAEFRKRAEQVYGVYAGPYKRRFKWLPPVLFQKTLAQHLREDAAALQVVLAKCAEWEFG